MAQSKRSWRGTLILNKCYVTYNVLLCTPSYYQGEYDMALVDREGNQLYFGSYSLSQVMQKFYSLSQVFEEVCFLSLSHIVQN